MKKVIVGGTFDRENGKSSKIVARLVAALGSEWEVVNGGNLDLIDQLNPSGASVLIWMPNISNEEEKRLADLKKKNPRMLLIQSKRIVEKHYTHGDLVGRMLQSHAVMCIAIFKDQDKYRFQLLDVLGNMWSVTDDLSLLAYSITTRLNYVTKLHRVGSVAHQLPEGTQAIVPDQQFVDVVKLYGDAFTKFVNAVNPYRLLGNASTRCAKGFPAARAGDKLLVTRRNVDKTTLSPEDFVMVEPTLNKHVVYYGSNKPSVDTPIQVKLFEYYHNVNFMIHGHVYILDAQTTSNKVPCGYLEEFDEIVEMHPDPNKTDFAVNLAGHGCLIMASSLDYLYKRLPYLVARPFPEH